MSKISVAVCTYNRQDYLKRCLASLALQTVPSNAFDVIVVDNASTDGTKETVLDWCQKNPNFSYVYEPVQGLARARNTALAVTRSDIIAYTDDDATVPRDWVEKYLASFASQPLDVVAVGGEIDAIFEGDRPSWLNDDLMRPLSAALNWSTRARLLKGDEWLCEVNSAYRTETLRKYGGFPEQLGRQGDLLLSGENFVNTVMRQDGFKEFFDPSIRVSHHVPKSRLTKEWFRRRYFWQGVTSALIPDIAVETYGQTRKHWEQVTVPMSPREWISLLTDDGDDADFQHACNRIAEIGYLLTTTKVVAGR